ncbi:hypothetical protein [Lentilitoribacter sp. EG35]|jgi:hypothetical protein|uniref:hypothetical protein n=1 Tax=Lentilitoribacter sp. EG35 TaxID=3234192 RepID=UPI00345F84DC
MEITRRETLTAAAILFAVSSLPVKSKIFDSEKIVTSVTKMKLSGSNSQFSEITNRRKMPGFLSQKIVKNDNFIVLIEEWKNSEPSNSQSYQRQLI